MLQEKANAYDKALKEASIAYKDGDKHLKATLGKIFPELIKSEDERIRKDMITWLKGFIGEESGVGYTEDEIKERIAWLKNRGKVCKITWHGISEEPREQEELLCEWDSDTDIFHDIVFYHADTKTFWNCEVKIENVVKWAYLNEILEPQGTQKPTDVELRFKVGDWVVNKYGYVWHVDSFDKKYCQVSNVKGNDCYFKISDQDEFHLWTIDDAKDGDMLVCDDSNTIAIFKNIYDKESFTSRGFVGHCTGTFELGQTLHDIAGAHPATKEQRVLLFQKMKEAGYEWSDEEKLKKI